MDALYSLVGTLIALGVLITAHEFGHFWVARRCGVYVVRFSIGFGLPLFRWNDRHGTEFVIAAIPLGGYVQMLDSQDEHSDQAIAYNTQPVRKRMAIIFAGPFFNFLLAFFLFWVVACIGKEQVIPIIGQVAQASLAEKSGLTADSEIISVNGVLTPSWSDVTFQLFKALDEEENTVISMRQQGSEAIQNFILEKDNSNVIGILGQGKDFLSILGISPWQPNIIPRVSYLATDGPASKAGLKEGDLLLKVNGEPIKDWYTFVQLVKKSPGEKKYIEIDRLGKAHSFYVDIASRRNDNDGVLVGYFGAGVDSTAWPANMLRHNRYDVSDAALVALQKTYSVMSVSLDSIVKILQGLLSAKTLSGPISIAKVAGDSAQAGFVDFLGFMAFLSISVGIFNLLPIPTLDGGHLVFQLFECILGRPVSENMQAISAKIGMVLISAIMFFVIFNDLSQL